MGAIAQADYDGTRRLRKVENQVTPFSVVEGDGGVMVDRTASQSRREMFNAVQITWESPTVSGTVFVVDVDPDSQSFGTGRGVARRHRHRRWTRLHRRSKRLTLLTHPWKLTKVAHSRLIFRLATIR